eukprot:7379977-Pyramimonas_sp.AAC.1
MVLLVQVSLYNLQNASAPGEESGMGVNADFSAVTSVGSKKPMLKAPSFMQRPCSVAFGFGGRL